MVEKTCVWCWRRCQQRAACLDCAPEQGKPVDGPPPDYELTAERIAGLKRLQCDLRSYGIEPIELLEEDSDTRDANLAEWRESLSRPTFHEAEDDAEERAAIKENT